MTLRIPSDSLNSFVAHVDENANVVTSNETIDDVTTQYVDTESHIKALEIEQERLLELLSKADTMEDILTIEKRLTNVRYELESFTSQLRVLDNQVTYATVRIYITEVQEYTPVIEEEPTTWERIRDGFGDSIENITEGIREFVIWFLVNSPFLVIWAAILTGIYLVVRKKFIRKPVKKAPKPQDKSE
jgi:chromosome segregation ATPase